MSIACTEYTPLPGRQAAIGAFLAFIDTFLRDHPNGADPNDIERVPLVTRQEIVHHGLLLFLEHGLPDVLSLRFVRAVVITISLYTLALPTAYRRELPPILDLLESHVVEVDESEVITTTLVVRYLELSTQSTAAPIPVQNRAVVRRPAVSIDPDTSITVGRRVLAERLYRPQGPSSQQRCVERRLSPAPSLVPASSSDDGYFPSPSPPHRQQSPFFVDEDDDHNSEDNNFLYEDLLTESVQGRVPSRTSLSAAPISTNAAVPLSARDRSTAQYTTSQSPPQDSAPLQPTTTPGSRPPLFLDPLGDSPSPVGSGRLVTPDLAHPSCQSSSTDSFVAMDFGTPHLLQTTAPPRLRPFPDVRDLLASIDALEREHEVSLSAMIRVSNRNVVRAQRVHLLILYSIFIMDNIAYARHPLPIDLAVMGVPGYVREHIRKALNDPTVVTLIPHGIIPSEAWILLLGL
ncbi:hypothetical protein BDN72DRAFT_906286 [Pluteus cervinus]|uniref:Uncharacterized protein n=1 Tax=Pluteus cervinus TaxID=181527 RepID=A0ACD3A0M3_9AGAR|nr:hypothetical protein BDN72DRAFT_906286 [Pluteus cervinus]